MEYSVHSGEDVRSSLSEAGFVFPCGGASLCGKCKIRVLSGSVAATDADRLFLSEEELAEGFRLACNIGTAAEELALESCVEGIERTMYIPGEAGTMHADGEPGTMHAGGEADTMPVLSDYSIAIDIGTTTIAVALVNASGAICDVYTCVNSQRSFGMDVVSRIVASNNGYGPAMRDAVISDIDAGIKELFNRNGLSGKVPEHIAVVGNTVMQHIFAGYSCEGLGVAPFTPVSLARTATPSGILMPGISAYVGADLVAGIAYCHMSEAQEISLLIDLGTNGELALGNSEKILTASAAAGPAFEGGNISCGCGSVSGAISRVQLSDDDNEEPIRLTVIGSGQKACGLCGTGVISLAAELLRQGLTDEHGTFDERLGHKIRLVADGSVTFTQKDMRELQLAKAAVRTGIDTMLLRYGVEYADIAHVYIAGGFGTELVPEDAAAIGLLPEELVPVTQAVGNAALKGAVRCLYDDVSEYICSISSEIILAEDEYFNSSFIGNTEFHCF